VYPTVEEDGMNPQQRWYFSIIFRGVAVFPFILGAGGLGLGIAGVVLLEHTTPLSNICNSELGQLGQAFDATAAAQCQSVHNEAGWGTAILIIGIILLFMAFRQIRNYVRLRAAVVLAGGDWQSQSRQMVAQSISALQAPVTLNPSGAIGVAVVGVVAVIVVSLAWSVWLGMVLLVGTALWATNVGLGARHNESLLTLPARIRQFRAHPDQYLGRARNAPSPAAATATGAEVEFTAPATERSSEQAPEERSDPDATSSDGAHE
jgi:hypothetical protein